MRNGINFFAKVLFLCVYLFSQNSFAQKQPVFTDDVSWSCTPVKDQGKTGTCWSFSAYSFIESELLRQGYEAIDLSEMYTVRNIYLEKAERYIRKHGTSNFSQGALAHDAIKSIEKYGLMPEAAYSGMLEEGMPHDHSAMETELKQFLDSMVINQKVFIHWKDSLNVIMDRYMGKVPETFSFYDQQTNASLFKSFFSIEPNDYIGLTSFTHHPYYTSFAIELPDNFSENSYYNLPLDQLFQIIDDALKNGFTIEWDGDVSEEGFNRKAGVAVLGAYDQKSSWPVKEAEVTPQIRQLAFDTYETTDDHLMHIVGLSKDQHGNKFYKLKNSWGTKSGKDGFVYMSEAYMKMKTVSVFLHKEALPVNIRF